MSWSDHNSDESTEVDINNGEVLTFYIGPVFNESGMIIRSRHSVCAHITSPYFFLNGNYISGAELKKLQSAIEQALKFIKDNEIVYD